MSYTLIGSQTSPFVRRIRMLMENLPFEFKEMNIFETDDALTLNEVNPLNQVPVLLHHNQKIWDSRQIIQYLNSKHKFQSLTLDEENILTAIDGAMGSGVSLLLMKRSGMDVDQPYMFVNRQKERIDSVLDFLRPYLQDQEFTKWNILSMTLYCFLDWGTYRAIVNLDSRPEFKEFMNSNKDRAIVIATQIPKV